MKNIEKYSKEILEYASSTEKAIAVCKETMKPCDCSATSDVRTVYAVSMIAARMSRCINGRWLNILNGRRYQRKTGRFLIILKVINIWQEIKTGTYMHIQLYR